MKKKQIIRFPSAEYFGEVNKKGDPHGKGFVSFKNGFKYEGNWVNDQKDGAGVQYQPEDNWLFKVLFKKGKIVGKGKDLERYNWNKGNIITFNGGGEYIGTVRNGKRHGQGTMTWPSHEASNEPLKYVGGWKNDKYCDNGTAYNFTTKKLIDGYKGEWKNGFMNGKGTMYHDEPCYEKLEGIFKNGFFIKGKQTFYDGTFQYGFFQRSKTASFSLFSLNGYGASEEKNGTKIFGNFKDGKTNGICTVYYNNGDKYVGNHKKGVRHGKGIYTWVSCETWEGNWKNNKMHGKGIARDLTGYKEVSIYKDDKLIKVIEEDYEDHSDYGHKFYEKHEQKKNKTLYKKEIEQFRKKMKLSLKSSKIPSSLLPKGKRTVTNLFSK